MWSFLPDSTSNLRSCAVFRLFFDSIFRLTHAKPASARSSLLRQRASTPDSVALVRVIGCPTPSSERFFSVLQLLRLGGHLLSV